jgi:tRNA threonylcarbamoyladenosine biosynthesis protein TsaE
MSSQQFTIHSIDELPQIAKAIIQWAGEEKIWLLNGEMGAGKTTLSKAICKALGVIDTVSSPTFAIVNEYTTQNHQTIYHFDFYRLKNEREALDIGVEDYFYSENLCLIEWASQIPSLIPAQHLVINLQKDLENPSLRVITLEKNRIIDNN